MRRLIRAAATGLTLAGAVACYRLPLHIRENDATGYEEVGIPTIEAVKYTPGGRDLRVSLEASGYVTVIIVDPERGATVRFKRGELQSQWVDQGVHRFALDRLAIRFRRPQAAARALGAGTRRAFRGDPRRERVLAAGDRGAALRRGDRLTLGAPVGYR